MTEQEQTEGLNTLLDYLKHTRGFDFSGYKRANLSRRIHKRIQMVGLTQYTDYIDYLEVHPDEFTQLFNTILINVTEFFRDADAWEYISNEILPRLLHRKSTGQPLRIWSAGCASGEEAYTITMLLAEMIGEDDFHSKVRIYATDLDEETMVKARVAGYGDREIANVPPALVERYFERSNDCYTFRKDLRRSVIFGRHNLIEDAPISKIDLLICRNTLMYFNTETQTRVLNRLHFALNNNGYLFLGRAEMLLTHTDMFTPVDLKERIFTKSTRLNMRDRVANPATVTEEAVNNLVDQVRLRDLALDGGPTGQILLNHVGVLVAANEKARQMFGISALDANRPFQDLQVSYRPVELRSQVELATQSRKAIQVEDVSWTSPDGRQCSMNIHVIPLIENGGTLMGINLVFIDTTEQHELQFRVETANNELETALEELQSTNEELETTNEELQSTVEELETTNEELQSTNEELETMNEELQSTNEELETLNNEMHGRSGELNRANLYLESILSNLNSGVVAVDQEARIVIWNRRSEDLWGLRSDEVNGQNFFTLDIGLPIDLLKHPVREALAGKKPETEILMHATNRRGRAIDCMAHFIPTRDDKGAVSGLILVIDEVTEPS